MFFTRSILIAHLFMWPSVIIYMYISELIVTRFFLFLSGKIRLSLKGSLYSFWFRVFDQRGYKQQTLYSSCQVCLVH